MPLFRKQLTTEFPDLTFRPTHLPGCKLWLEARSIIGADGAAVAAWQDLSGNNIACTATGTQKMLYKTNVVNSHPALLSDGSDDRFTVGAFTLGTLVIAAKYTNATFVGYDGLWGEDGGAENIYFTGTGGGTDWFSARGTLTLYKDGTADTTGVVNAWHVFTAKDSSPISLNWEIGEDRDQAGRRWHGYVYGLAAYDTALSDANRKLVEQYFGGKVGVSIP